MELKGLRVKGVLMDEKAIDTAIDRMAEEIESRHSESCGLLLIGIKTRGVPIADRIAEKISKSRGMSVTVGTFDISFYRDDLSLIWEKPVVKGHDFPDDITGKKLIIVDDVLYTGRTIIAAIDEILDMGRPAKVELAVLVDRGHREFPLCPDYCGLKVETTKREIIKVQLKEVDGRDEVLILEREG
ncbi:MAG: bifunctional pyr operon transcriptional regulator/uracil phosphoribosyltransferase PyrR [Candidatus Hydrothermota bacterium]|nr:MAG: bifunctional pyr operon transcriptional regulator/uracil phosphoribosyltransferase PyrR [Candidatus Hydrothermae bacterium]